MKNKKKALLLTGIASLGILCGCGKEKHKTIETGDGTYVESNGEYVKVVLEPKTYEPGTHIIIFNDHLDSTNTRSYNDGWEYSYFSIPEPPEGYKYVNTVIVDQSSSGSVNIYAHIYVNEKTVEVTPIYNAQKNTINYCNPGVVVEEKTLELGD